MPYAQDTREKSNFPALISTDGNLTHPVGYFGVELVTAVGNTLNIGDAVYIDSTGAAAKSVTAANYITGGFIVVGGHDFPYNANAAAFGSNQIGVLAAKAGNIVMVALVGVMWGVSGGTIAAGARVGPDATTAGAVGVTSEFFAVTLAASTIGVAVPLLLAPQGRLA